MDSDRSDPTPASPRPVSVRAGAPEATRPPSVREAAPPVPVRRAMDAGDVPFDSVQPDAEEVSLEVEGVPWTVRVLGRSRGGPATAPTDLLLLGFCRMDGANAQGDLECLVVGRTLSGLTEHDLVASLASATPPPDPNRPRTLFPGAAERRPRKG